MNYLNNFSINCGGYHTICLTENSNCYVFGYNIFGQLGLGDKNERLIPNLLTLPNNEKIKYISCGEFHTICLTDNSNCYVFGNNYYGQLGLGDTKERLIPALFTLSNNEKIKYIACGYSHTSCLTENSNYYVFGSNTFGQLGLGDTNERFIPTLLNLPNNEKIKYIACGSNHTICLTENSNCYVFGKNNYGQLGLGDTNNRLIPTLLTLPNNEKIKYISCCSNHTICLTNNEKIYVWGFNYYGQLGLGDINERLIPTLLTLPNNEKIKYITCGYYYTICLTENSNYYVFGNNYSGQLGLGDTNNRLIPTLLTLPNNQKIKYITCGGYHTICITENEQIYIWGLNDYGQLGLGDTNDRLIPTLLTLPNNEKILNPFKNLYWNISNHSYSSLKIKKIIKTLLILNLRTPITRDAKYSESIIYWLPKEILLYSFTFLNLN